MSAHGKYGETAVPATALRLFLLLSIRKGLERSGIPLNPPTLDELDAFIQRASMRIPLGVSAAMEMFVEIKEQIHQICVLVDGLLRELLDEKTLKEKMAKVIQELDGLTASIFLSDSEFRGQFEESFQETEGSINTLLLCLAQDGLLTDSSVTNLDSLPSDTKRRFLEIKSRGSR